MDIIDTETNDIKTQIDPESDLGNVEYKYTLTGLNDRALQNKASQFMFRLDEGVGQAHLYLGITDNGHVLGIVQDILDESLENIDKILDIIDAKILQKNIYKLDSTEISKDYVQIFLYNNCRELLDTPFKRIQDDKIQEYAEIKQDRYVAKLIITKNHETKRETRVVVLGGVDAGKSTLLGVLTKQCLDNGRGSARASVLTHPHEIETGRTSCIGVRLLGFDNDKKIVNKLRDTPKDIMDKSNKLCTLYDLAGHLPYLRTTIKGVCSTYSDLALIIVGGNMGIREMTKEHIRLAYLHSIPMAVIFTKIDFAPAEVLKNNITNMKMLLKSANYQPLMIKTEQDVLFYKRNNSSEMVPIIQLSNVTGENMDLLVRLLYETPKQNNFSVKLKEPFYYTITETFMVPGIGVVLSGLVLSGQIRSRTSHWLGPFSDNSFKRVFIKSIQYKRVNVDYCQADQSVTFAIRSENTKEEIKREDIKYGMTLYDGSKPQPKGFKNFTAELSIVGRHATTVKENYEALINCSNIRQVAKIDKIISISRKSCEDDVEDKIDGHKYLRGGDTAIVSMHWRFQSVFVPVDTIFIFRENRIKGHGKILSID